jgi:DNA polymerase-3 subunit delta'
MLSNSTASRLDTLSGLDSAKRLVRSLLTKETGVHAVLLYGMPGAGQVALAEILAAGWLANASQDEDRALGAFWRGNNPDSLIIRPAGPSNLIPVGAIAGESNSDGSVSLKEFFRSAPIMSRHKVAVIQQAHRLNLSAANALLKTLEEPHAHGKMILTTESVGEVLTTVRSRCLSVVCELPTQESADPILSQVGIPTGREADYQAQHSVLSDLVTFATGLKSRKVGEALALAEEFRKLCDRFETKERGARLSQAEMLSFFANVASKQAQLPPEWAHAIIEAHRRIIGNGSAPLVFDALFSKMLLSQKN